jgi:hypothetical protein
MNFATTLKRSHWTGRDMRMRESFQQNTKAIVTAAITGGGYHQIISFELFSLKDVPPDSVLNVAAHSSLY